HTPEPVKKNDHIELITNAKYKTAIPSFKALSAEEIDQINTHPHTSPYMPQQEKGIRPSRPLPYQLYGEGKLSGNKQQILLSLAAGNEIFGDRSAGAPFLVYATGTWKDLPGFQKETHGMRTWNYAVSPGDTLTDSWQIADFDNGTYRLEVY